MDQSLGEGRGGRLCCSHHSDDGGVLTSSTNLENSLDGATICHHLGEVQSLRAGAGEG
jgi:hypothetical protein